MTNTKKNKFSVYFVGTVTTLTPYANSPAGCQKSEGSAKSGKLSMLPRLPVRGPDSDTFVEVPVISASALRGAIRRNAAKIVLNRMRDHHESITFDDWLFWTIGGVKGKGSNGKSLCARRRLEIIDNNPLLAAFGAGDAGIGGMVGGRFMIDTVIPNGPLKLQTIGGKDAGEAIGRVRVARRAEQRNPDLGEYLDASEFNRVQEYEKLNTEKFHLNAELTNLKSSLRKREMELKAANPTEWSDLKATDTDYARLEKEIKSKEKEVSKLNTATSGLASDNSIGMIQPGYEVIPQGAEFPHQMTIKSSTQEQIGFVLDTLLRTAQDDTTFGAHVASGMGRLKMEYDVFFRSEDSFEREYAGRVVIEPGKGVDTFFGDAGPFLKDAHDAWLSAPFVPENFRKAVSIDQGASGETADIPEDDEIVAKPAPKGRRKKAG